MDPDPFPTPGKGLVGSLADAARKQHADIKQSLEPDPNADEITRIDQEWIKQCSRLLPIDKAGLLKAPTFLGPLGPLIGISVGALLLLQALSRQLGIATIGLYCFAIFGLVLLVAGVFGLINMAKYFVAARAYRQRRAKTLALHGRSDAGPLPVIDRPVWVQSGMMDVETALQQLDGAYRNGRIKSAEYMRARAAYLEYATPEERQRLDQEPLWLNDRRR